ncbi:MAG TPA: hypothetical protein VJN21_13395 [Candidatus Acidoferrales bacterium]|nr:hypothetical protein [Candidatus Acidoferrales bacterium]
MNTSKKLVGCLSIVAAGLWLMALPAAAQRPSGAGQGHPGGGAGASGTHEPMGMGSAMSNGHAMNGTHGSKSAMGPKAPGDLLTQNTKLSSKLAPLAGCTGTQSQIDTCMQAAVGGFKNLGQFVSAVHVSNNLGIPFTTLKCTELGTTAATSLGMTCPASVTNTGKMSLGGAIHTIRPTLSSTDVKSQTSRASKQAHGDMSSKS